MKLTHVLLALVCILGAAVVQADSYIAGQHYKVLENQTTPRDSKKIEVVEAFWYGCGHCNNLEPTVQAWKKFLQADVDFYQVPAQFGRQWKIHADLFYVTHALEVNEKVNQGIFDSIHKQQKSLLSPGEQQAFLEQYGVSKADFEKHHDSFGVRRQMKMADEMIRAWGISGVPAIVVNGKYMVNASSAGGEQKIFDVVNYLIEQERKILTK